MAYPTKLIAGIQVPYTDLIHNAIDHVKSQSPPWLFNHVMRSWLFATIIASSEANSAVDHQALALASILHDTGFISDHMTPERRFEVDGAEAAVAFIRSQDPPSDPSDPKYRLRELLVWEAIALHTTSSIALHASREASFCHRGTGMDFVGRGVENIPSSKLRAILDAFPRLDMKNEFKDSLCSLARNKPETTYDNFVGGFGEAYVEGYKRKSSDARLVLALALNRDPNEME